MSEHRAIANLRTNQRQLDMDGCEVAVSRQALDETLALTSRLTGALNFIMAFYVPGQRHLDTNAWKQAECSGWLALFDAGCIEQLPTHAFSSADVAEITAGKPL